MHWLVVSVYTGVVLGGAGGAMAPPDFGRPVTPISTRGTDYSHLITTGTPGFSDLPTALDCKIKLLKRGKNACILSSLKGCTSRTDRTLR